ncbi:MAG TPA: hypothetical protein PKD37_05385 [Oligoflexia bacterium]|nr:hypothetical protein [Oligoflexia bacterium]HMP27398.1 hypothetical protein [Oligoflexia bacterium]
MKNYQTISEKTLQLTPIYLSKIARQIERGQPLWGILTFNEILDKNDPLRRAAAIRAEQILRAKYPKIKEKGGKFPIVCATQIIGGKKLAELSGAEQKELDQYLKNCEQPKRAKNPPANCKIIPINFNLKQVVNG